MEPDALPIEMMIKDSLPRLELVLNLTYIAEFVVDTGIHTSHISFDML